MNWICPLCKKENKNELICTCGFDESKNYHQYATLSKLNKEQKSAYVQEIKSKQKIDWQNPRRTITWDSIYFGSYPQKEISVEDLSGKKYRQIKINGEFRYFQYEPIKWRVLQASAHQLFLLSDKILDLKVFDEEKVSSRYAESTISSWLNHEFFQEAFSKEEKESIKETTLTNKGNQKYKTLDDKDTVEKVFLLAEEETYAGTCAISYGFSSEPRHENKARIAKESDYVKALRKEKADENSWQLRTAGFNQKFVMRISGSGMVRRYGKPVHTHLEGVRPALCLDLASSYQYAGKISVEENFIRPAKVKEQKIENKEKTEIDLHNPRIVYDSGEKSVIWDCVYLGKSLKGKAIKWRVLEVRNGKALLLANDVLYTGAYNATRKDVTWKTSTIRSWLNGYGSTHNAENKNYLDKGLLQRLFTSEERKAITLSTIKNSDNEEFLIKGGGDTKDYLFLLSQEEVSTDYVNNKVEQYGFSINYSKKDFAKQASYDWWLRTPGYTATHAMLVSRQGYVYRAGTYVSDIYYGVRPALWLNLSITNAYTYAGVMATGSKK